MTALLENPAPIIAVGIALEAVLAVAFVHTRRRGILVAMVGVGVLVLAGVVLERLILTDTEQIEAATDGAIEALEADDLPQFEQYLARSAVETRARAAYALGIVEITRFRTSGVDIQLNPLTSPPTAEVRFHASVHYRERKGKISYGIYRAAFVVTLQWEAGRWLITGHSEGDELP